MPSVYAFISITYCSAITIFLLKQMGTNLVCLVSLFNVIVNRLSNNMMPIYGVKHDQGPRGDRIKITAAGPFLIGRGGFIAYSLGTGRLNSGRP